MDGIEIRRLLARKSYWKNREKRLEAQKRYRAANKDKIKRYYEVYKEQMKTYRQKNKEKYAAYSRKSYWKRKAASDPRRQTES